MTDAAAERPLPKQLPLAAAAEPAPTDDALTISEVALACGVERRVIEKRLRQGDFPNAWRALPQPGGPMFQSLWHIPVSDLRSAGFAVDKSRIPVRATPPAAAAPMPPPDLARVREERDEWQRRALVAEALAEERLRALEDARRILAALTSVVEHTHNGAEPAADEEEPEAPEQKLRGNWLL
jgi:hypothetical protein